MRIRNADIPIKIPDLIRAGDPITARWANGIRESIQRLRDRMPVVHGVSLPNIPPCPFGKFTGDDDNNICLEGGMVIGGISSILVDKIPIANRQTDGSYVYVGEKDEILFLQINYTPNIADDIILPGVDVIDEVTVHIELEIPEAQLPTTTEQNGIHYYTLGIFDEKRFSPSGCGNLQLAHCPGSSTVTRQ